METIITDSKVKKVALHTLGCRLNFSETGSIAQGFKDRGYEIVDFGQNADVVFINTCTVTDGADSTCRNLIRKAHKSSPEGKVVVAGCYAQMEAEKISKIQGVDLILGNWEKYKVFDYLNEDHDQLIKIEKSNEFWGAATTPADTHTRAFLKIQDGCNYICSFCIIPFARGRSRVIKIADAVSQARGLVEKGFKEIVLTGVNIGEYERHGEKLSDLVKQVLRVDGLERLRLSSVEPNTITDELLEVFSSSDKFMDHFHVPLQSGDNDILKSMRRKYLVEDYERIIERIKDAFPQAGIGADVICGFPGESDEQFQNTFNLLRKLPITHFHVFPFSKRKGTTAAAMDNHIQHGLKKERVKTLMMLGEAKLDSFARNQVGSSSQVLFEKRDNEGLFEGYSSNFVKIKVDSQQDLSNKIIDVRLKEFRNGSLYGELLQ